MTIDLLPANWLNPASLTVMRCDHNVFSSKLNLPLYDIERSHIPPWSNQEISKVLDVLSTKQVLIVSKAIQTYDVALALMLLASGFMVFQTSLKTADMQSVQSHRLRHAGVIISSYESLMEELNMSIP